MFYRMQLKPPKYWFKQDRGLFFFHIMRSQGVGTPGQEWQLHIMDVGFS